MFPDVEGCVFEAWESRFIRFDSRVVSVVSRLVTAASRFIPEGFYWNLHGLKVGHLPGVLVPIDWDDC